MSRSTRNLPKTTDVDNEDWLNEPDNEQEKQVVPLDVIENLKDFVRNANRHRLEISSVRNVMIVGKSRSGKSTAVGVLKDPTHEAETMSIFAESSGPRFQSFSLSDTKDDAVNYILNIIDTPGLHEEGRPGDVERTDESILKSISFCLKNEITKIHMLVICVSAFQGLAKEEVAVFTQYIDAFYHKDVPIVICVTRAEGKTEKEKAKMVEEFQQHRYFGPLLNRGNVFVEFMGCVDEGILTTATDEEQLKKMYKNVYKLRTKLLLDIFAAERDIPLVELPASQEPLRQAMSELEEQLKRLQTLDECKDFQVQSAKMLVRDVIKANNKLRDMEVITLLGKDENVLITIKAIKRLMAEIARKMPENMGSLFTQGRIDMD